MAAKLRSSHSMCVCLKHFPDSLVSVPESFLIKKKKKQAFKELKRLFLSSADNLCKQFGPK